MLKQKVRRASFRFENKNSRSDCGKWASNRSFALIFLPPGRFSISPPPPSYPPATCLPLPSLFLSHPRLIFSYIFLSFNTTKPVTMGPRRELRINFPAPPLAIEWCLCVGVMHHSRPPLLWLPDPTASLGAITPPSSLQSLTPSSVLLTLLTRSIKQGIVALPELLFNNELGFLERWGGRISREPYY